jgi:hypothetical protein
MNGHYLILTVTVRFNHFSNYRFVGYHNLFIFFFLG